MSEEYPTNASTIREGDKVRFEIGQTVAAFPRRGVLDLTISGTVLLVTEGGYAWPHHLCLSLTQGNFWFDLDTQIVYTGHNTLEELDCLLTENYGEGFPNA